MIIKKTYKNQELKLELIFLLLFDVGPESIPVSTFVTTPDSSSPKDANAGQKATENLPDEMDGTNSIDNRCEEPKMEEEFIFEESSEDINGETSEDQRVTENQGEERVMAKVLKRQKIFFLPAEEDMTEED